MNTIHDGVVYRCERCDLVLVTKNALRWHNRSRHSEKTFHCERCDLKCVNNSSLKRHKRTHHEIKKNVDCFQKEVGENYEICDKDDLVKDEKVKKKEEQSEILMESSLQQYEAEKPVPPIENKGMIMKCNDCSYSSQNEDISKLHLLSHKYSETEIMKRIPPTLKNLTFVSEEEFSKNLDVLLESLSATTKKKN